MTSTMTRTPIHDRVLAEAKAELDDDRLEPESRLEGLALTAAELEVSARATFGRVGADVGAPLETTAGARKVAAKKAAAKRAPRRPRAK